MKLFFLCGARDFHAMDWYRSAKEVLPPNEVMIVTDLIEGEGFNNITKPEDKIYKLIILDKILFKNQSSLGNVWRNILKLLFLPIQVFLLRRFYRNKQDGIFHAHSMYYLWLAWIAKVPFVGTPQGSDILLKLDRSKIFRFMSIKAMRAAKAVTVDSEAMKSKISEVSGINAHVIQNGIDLNSIAQSNKIFETKVHRTNTLLSIRGFTSLYRIDSLLTARNKSSLLQNMPIKFIYPFYDDSYRHEISPLLQLQDMDVGRVGRDEMYQIMRSSTLIISVPRSDSSPRSVYESVFCGSAVAITYNKYYDVLPACMKSRIVIVDLAEEYWLEKAYEKAVEICSTNYTPSEEALDMFDQRRSFKKVSQLLFN